jgi:hypothetical protein
VAEIDRRRIDALVAAALARGEPTSWFEELYAGAAGPEEIPWADFKPNPALVEWAEREVLTGRTERALVVGAGLGDDAEYLAARGFDVVGFDIAPSSVRWARRANPGSSVEYVVADAADPPPEWRQAFGFVLEVFTLQSVPPEPRGRIARGIASTVAPGGALLAIALARRTGEPAASQPPFPLTPDEVIDSFTPELEVVTSEEIGDPRDPEVRRLRVLFTRPR